MQLDSIVDNELLNPDELIETDKGARVLRDWRDMEHLKLLNIAYDITPSKFITMIVTEVGMMPPTSVPVIIREYEQGKNNSN